MKSLSDKSSDPRLFSSDTLDDYWFQQMVKDGVELTEANYLDYVGSDTDTEGALISKDVLRELRTIFVESTTHQIPLMFICSDGGPNVNLLRWCDCPDQVCIADVFRDSRNILKCLDQCQNCEVVYFNQSEAAKIGVPPYWQVRASAPEKFRTELRSIFLSNV